MTDDDLKAELEQAIDRVFRGHPFPTVREMRDAIWPIVARDRAALREVQARAEGTVAWLENERNQPAGGRVNVRDVIARLAPAAPEPKERDK